VKPRSDHLLLTPISGHIGEIDLTRYPASPALYVAQDKDTCLQELFNDDLKGRKGLSSRDLALTRADSVSIVAVKGSLESVLDLNRPDKLKPFVQLIKKFELSSSLIKDAKKIGFDVKAAQNVQELLGSVLNPNWRQFPMHVDVPASSQIFGNLVEQAGIDAVLYPSKYTKKNCLAIYIRNFKKNGSFVELAGELSPGVAVIRLDSNNCGKF
jgi:hypothetical protein